MASKKDKRNGKVEVDDDDFLLDPEQPWSMESSIKPKPSNKRARPSSKKSGNEVKKGKRSSPKICPRHGKNKKKPKPILTESDEEFELMLDNFQNSDSDDEKEEEEHKKKKKKRGVPEPIYEEVMCDSSSQVVVTEMLLEKLNKIKSRRDEDEEDEPPEVADAPSTSGRNGVKKVKKRKTKRASQEEEEKAVKRAQIKSLIERYDKNKKKSAPPSKRKKISPLANSDSEWDCDDSVFQEDMKADAMGISTCDFAQFTLPQYDLKLKLYEMHAEVIERMTNFELGQQLKPVIPELIGIARGKLRSRRHDLFNNNGRVSKLTGSLSSMYIGDPFGYWQQEHLTNLIMEKVYGSRDRVLIDLESEIHYINQVLVPEAQVRIYARVNKISLAHAEKELRHQERYDGELSPELIASLQG